MGFLRIWMQFTRCVTVQILYTPSVGGRSSLPAHGGVPMKMRGLSVIAASAAAFLLVAANTSANHSWGGYHWARTANPFTIKAGDNVDSSWDAYLDEAISDWNQSVELDLAKVAGRYASSRAAASPPPTAPARPAFRAIDPAALYLVPFRSCWTGALRIAGGGSGHFPRAQGRQVLSSGSRAGRAGSGIPGQYIDEQLDRRGGKR